MDETTTPTNPLPRDEDGFVKTSAEFGMAFFVRITYNSDTDGKKVDYEDWSNVTLHGPIDDFSEAEQWMQDYPDGDKDVKDMDVITVNRVRPA